MYKIIVFFTLALLSLVGKAQDTIATVTPIPVATPLPTKSSTPTRFVELSFSTNAYKGDLSHSYSQWGNAVHIGFLLNRKKRLNGHFNLMIGSAVAQNGSYFFDDGTNPQPSPNNYARIRMIALNYDLRLHVYKKKNLYVYLYQGIGLLRFDPRDQENKKLSDQLNTRAANETYSNIAAFLPHGIGAMYFFKPLNLAVGMQAGFLNPTTDFLDNIGKWGNRAKNDNLLSYKLTFAIPLQTKNKTIIK